MNDTLPTNANDPLRFQPFMVMRPWGWYIEHYRTKHYVFKTLYVLPGHQTSLQKHISRREQWFIYDGKGSVTVAMSLYHCGPMCDYRIGMEQRHRLANTGDKSLVVAEMQYGPRCCDEDIVRLEPGGKIP